MFANLSRIFLKIFLIRITYFQFEKVLFLSLTKSNSKNFDGLPLFREKNDKLSSKNTFTIMKVTFQLLELSPF